MVGFVSLPDEHAPSAKSRIRRVLHPQRTDPMKPPRSAPPAGVEPTLLPHRVSHSFGRVTRVGDPGSARVFMRVDMLLA